MKEKIFRKIKVFIVGMIIPFSIVIIINVTNAPVIVKNLITILATALMYAAFMSMIFIVKSGPQKFRKKESIYVWMDDLSNFDDRLHYLLKNQSVKYSILDNLSIIKENISKYANGNLDNLRLMKAYYLQYSKETSEELYLRTVMGVLVPLLIFFMGKNLPIFKEITVYSFFAVLMVVFITIAVITDRLNFNKRRLGITVEIIDICIKEIEDKKKKSDES
jgi:hypothetical protein